MRSSNAVHFCFIFKFLSISVRILISILLTKTEGKRNWPQNHPKVATEIAPQYCPSIFLWVIGFVTYYCSFPSQVCLQKSLSCATACAQSIFFCCKISDFDTSLSILTRNKSTHGFWISAVQKKVFIFLLGKQYIKVV